MELATLAGIACGITVLGWGIFSTGVGAVFINLHGLGLVVGGTLSAMMINSSFGSLIAAGRGLLGIFRRSALPSMDAAVAELVRLAQRAKDQGGILAVQGENPDFARGFLARALSAAVKNSETAMARQILEEEIRQRRIRRIDEENQYRTMAILFPMFGLIGTLIGIVGVLKNMSDPTKVGPAMALSITTAFYGIALSNLLCVPIAGKLRTRAMAEMLLYEVVMEGVLGILAGKQPFQVENHLVAYVGERKETPASSSGP